MAWEKGWPVLVAFVAILMVCCQFFPTNEGLQLRELSNWLHGLNGGVSLDKVEIAVEPGKGRGIRSTKLLEKKEVVARIPLQAMVSVEHAFAAFDGKFRDLDKLADLDLLVAFVLMQQDDGRLSRWYDFWNTLPNEPIASPLQFCERKLLALSQINSILAKELNETRKIMRERFLRSQLLQNAAKNDFDMFVRTWLLVQSRLFRIPILDKKRNKWDSASCMIPFADLLNTGPRPNADCAMDASNMFSCFVTKPLRKGEFLNSPYILIDKPFHTWIHYGFAANEEEKTLMQKLINVSCNASS